ncbi:MAG: NAD-dependent epimerase/dehydratase family protein, partial [Flavisolibacter sp.]
VNVEGTTNVVNLSIQNNISKLIHISSVAALGRTTKTDTINESKKWENTNNNTHYSITKNEAEMHVWRGFGEGLDGVILNPSTILGFGNWNESSCTLFKSAYKGFPWYTEGINGFVGVEDVAALTVEVAVSAISQKRFIVNSENWSFRQLFNTIADEFNKPRPTRKATPAIGELAWRLEKIRSLFTGKKPLLTKETSKVAHSHTSFDNSALLSFLPHFQYTPIATVIKASCEKYLRAMDKGMLTL